jgi:hypothetical protein
MYKALETSLEEDKKQELQGLQKSWLAYRDAECMWEAENAENSSLKRINELSCMARLTDDRADILTVVHEDRIQLETVREYGSFPRWMNVVAKENTDVYWDYGKRSGYDLDCDGEDEFVMTGVQTEAVSIDLPEGKEPLSHQVFKNHVVVALAQNTSVGKPTAEIFKFILGNSESENSVCDSNISLRYIEPTETDDEDLNDDTEKEVEEKICDAKLEIKSGKCDPKTIIWNGKGFELEKIEVLETEEAE